PNYYALHENYPLPDTFHAKHYLVPNEMCVQALVEKGVSKGRISECGFDAMGKASPYEEPESILFPLQGLRWENEIIQMLLRHLESGSYRKLILRSHPKLSRTPLPIEPSDQ